jgi:hypothetical protein
MGAYTVKLLNWQRPTALLKMYLRPQNIVTKSTNSLGYAQPLILQSIKHNKTNEEMNMDIITVTIGVIAIAYGIYAFYARAKKPESLGKLQAMRERFGAGTGTTIHTVAYSVMPIVLGSFIVYAGINGVSLLEFFAT